VAAAEAVGGGPAEARLRRPSSSDWDCRPRRFGPKESGSRLARATRGKSMTELWRRSAIDLAQLIATGQASSMEVVDAHLAAHRGGQSKLNAVVRCWRTPRGRSRGGGSQGGGGRGSWPSARVPITVKENIDMAACRPPMRSFRWRRHRSCDARWWSEWRPGPYRSAAPTSPTSGCGAHRQLAARPDPQPWTTPARRAAPAGEAAAWRRDEPLGLGNDIGGSLRNPASACGIASIRRPWARSRRRLRAGGGPQLADS